MSQPRIILASTSVYRKNLLDRIGIRAESVAPDVDEDHFKNSISDPEELATVLARAKAESVFAKNRDAIVIGGDQLATIDGKILGKPGTSENAVAQLQELSGRTHLLITAVCVLAPQAEPQLIVDHSRLTMRNLSKEMLMRYVERDRPIDCAGAYKLESAGIALFDQVQTEDHTAITGIPLLALVRVLSSLHVEIP